MTAAEWLTCDNPNHALDLLGSVGTKSRRKERLAAVAALRHVWADLSPDQRRAVAAAERFADGAARATEMQAAAVPPVAGSVGTLAGAVSAVTHRQVAHALRNATLLYLPLVVGGPVYTNPPFPAAQAYAERGRPMITILRCVFGNPFRSVALDPDWRTSDVLAMCRGMNDARDFAAMPILADALQDAGCEHPDILAHCRGPGPHVRGCWVVDLIMGKE